ncbi:FAD-dependent oxidoreductase [Puniceibacterium sp. IMCC21224]|uniref:oxidoreductase n=1 Tax=Puniceibacterium sp. IMCC21224 TaxID=1618204 RepID=UPI00065DAA07|nr:FAD-dependent oxidoreductase [Puniceibacterium sp. IMCC21224]KMK64911.1 NADH:flavin oxidoreductase [Puniceibacterium sp. IMCC21224]
MTDRYARVMTPLTIGGVEIRNRIFLPAHTTNFGRDFLPTEAHVAYLRARARAGVGLIFVEPLRVHPTSLGRAGGLSGADPRALDGLRRIVDAVRNPGARIFVQITHAGRHGPNEVDRLPAWGPSAVPWVAGGEMPHAMTRAEMVEVRDAYVRTAELAVAAGFEGIEVHLGHGHLLHQFLSPAANTRDDEYGGSLENRMRFPLEVLRAVVNAVGVRLAVGVRTSVDDLMPGAVGPQEHRIITRAAAALPGLAFVNASVAAYQWPSIGHHVADMAHPSHPFRDLTEALRPEIGNLPLLTANRYRSLSEAEKTLARGQIDMVGMNRAHMADPDLIAKSLAGREGEVRPCVAHNFCIGQIAAHQPISCMMNPGVGKEQHWSDPPAKAALTSRVLVVGGGPAGMEAARIAALAGHDVTIWERSGSLGGKLALCASGYGRGDIGAMRDWLCDAVIRAGVRIGINRDATVAALRDAGADVILLATGAQHDAGYLADASLLSPQMALSQPRDSWSGQRVALWDEAGSWATLSVAETLAQAGAQVEILQASTAPLWSVSLYSRMTALERLAQLGVIRHLGMMPRSASNTMLTCRNSLTSRETTLGPFDCIVHSAPGVAPTGFQDALEQVGLAVRTIGDAVAPRTLFDAMQDAQAAARSIGKAA